KGVLLLDWDENDLEINFQPLPISKDIRLISGSYADITQQDFVAKIQAEGPAYYSIRLTAKPQGVRNLRDTLMTYYSDILDIRIEEASRPHNRRVLTQERLESPLELIQQFFQEQTGQELTVQQRNWLEDSLLQSREEA
ncbi:exonuclease SbcCD subunit D C-terminal domain-containing protein, partial [Streptococcus danieliae]|nr:exonuclease SbcCD subunit D C-terminal domain-containing protein [Streptococcus danieliae]